ncbi:MAG: trigger factor [Spirochaetia bacterium]|uniref:trigger factor n=1 Tax=Treponema berlinense TaxID=225004 RepID=UPI0015BA0926|nr:trigger factor [Treponema berlinense]MDD5789262.1 trigger factor [Spirochaetia bacterium]
MKFTKEITKLEHSAVKLTVTVAKEDVADGYKTTLSKYVKQVQIPGFRKGHVPASVLERKYGEQIKLEAAGDLIDSALNEIFQDEKDLSSRPLPYAQPKMDEMPAFDTSKDFTFTVTYDVFPSVEVKDFNGISVKEPQVTVGDAEVEEELKGIQERNAAVIDKKEGEKAEKDNIVTIDIEEIAEDGKAVEGTKRQGFTFTIGTAENVYKIDDELIGMTAGETKEIVKKYPKTESDKELAGTTKKYSVTVKQIKERNLPALDDDLAQDVSDKYKTLADLKADILKNLNLAKDRKIKELKVNSLLEQLIEKNPVEIPASMLQAELNGRWAQMAQQFQTTPEALEKMVVSSGQKKEDMLTQWTGDAEKMLKSRIIVDSLLKSKNISVTPEEVEAAYQKLADSNGVSVEDVKKHYEDPRAKEWFIDDVKEQKLYDEIFAQIKVAKGDKTSFEDLFKAN